MSSQFSDPYFGQQQNPYQPSYVAPTPAKSKNTPGKVLAPAIALIVCGILDGMWGIFRIIGGALMGNEPLEIPPDAPPFMRDILEQAGNTSPAFEIVMGIVMTALAAIIVVGGVQMLRMKTWGLALTSAIVCMLPCITCLGCCGVGEGIGIWALIVLANPEVKGQFQ